MSSNGARPPGPINLQRYDYEVSYSGFQTFAKLPVCLTPEDLRAGGIEVAIGGVPWDGTQGTRSGTNLGPLGIRIADYLWAGEGGRQHLHTRVDPFEHLKMADYGDAQVLPGAVEASFGRMKDFVGEILDGGAKPIILGGAHAITWPNATALADRFGYGNVGIVHFDAHADTAPLSPGQLTSHGAPMRQLIESGAVLGRNFVQIGLRGYWPPPEIVEWMEERDMRTHFMAEIQRHGFAPCSTRRWTKPSTAPSTCSSASTSTCATRPSPPAPAPPSRAASRAPSCCGPSAAWPPRWASPAWTSSRSPLPSTAATTSPPCSATAASWRP